jgi:uncharacterized protein (TIGR00369 family)
MMRPLPPFATDLGLERDTETNTLKLVWSETAEGRPGFVHGGLLASVLEFACHDALAARLEEDGLSYQPVNFSVDFLRGGVKTTTYARAHITRFGNRVAHVQALAWQDQTEQPVAIARMHFLIRR